MILIYPGCFYENVSYPINVKSNLKSTFDFQRRKQHVAFYIADKIESLHERTKFFFFSYLSLTINIGMCDLDIFYFIYTRTYVYMALDIAPII